MFKFGERSIYELSSCDPRLQEVMNEVIKIMDFSVLCGNRSKEDQNEAYENGTSKLKYPRSNHNSMPSMAVDIAPYPIDWKNKERFIILSNIVKYIAKQKDIEIDWGYDLWGWDMPHYQIKEEV